MTVTLTYSIVDAFTAEAFRGNPAAVIVLDADSPLPDTTLQHIAAEFNLSETAFVTPINASKGLFCLRWFTPTMEVALCGHATLASASVLFSERAIMPKAVDVIEFQTVHSGVLTTRALADGRLELEFPAGEATAVGESFEQKAKAVVQRAFFNTPPSVRFVGTGDGASYGNYMVIEVVADYDLENATVNPDHFKELGPQYLVVIVTQRSSKAGESFRCRVFCPVGGIPEDPVTGSAHSILGPYWDRLLQNENTRGTEMIGKQVSARSGEIGVIVDREKGRCKLRGNATLVAKGEMYVPLR